MSNSRRRVKLFVLDEERQWSDRGTGHVSAIYTDQDNESKGIMLLVRSEEDGEYSQGEPPYSGPPLYI